MLNSLIRFSRLPRDVWLITLASGCLGFAYFGVWSVLFNLYLLRLGYGPETIGFLLSGGQLAWGIAALPSGILGDRIGNRNAFILGMFITVAGLVLLLLNELLPVEMRTVWIAFWFIVCWIASALFSVNGVPFIMAVCAPEERSDAFTLQTIAQGLLSFFGSLVGGVLPGVIANITGAGLDSSTVYFLPLWLAPLFYLIGAFGMLQSAPQRPFARTTASGQSSKLPILLMTIFALIVVLQTAGEGIVRAFINVYLDASLAVPTAQIGVVMGLGQLIPILVAFSVPLLIRSVGNERTMIISGLVGALFMMITAYFATLAPAALGFIGFLSTMSVAVIARSVLSQALVAPQWRTMMASAVSIGIALGWASASGLGGILIANVGYSTLFLVGALMAAASALVTWGSMRMWTPTKGNVAGKVPSVS